MYQELTRQVLRSKEHTNRYEHDWRDRRPVIEPLPDPSELQVLSVPSCTNCGQYCGNTCLELTDAEADPETVEDYSAYQQWLAHNRVNYVPFEEWLNSYRYQFVGTDTSEEPETGAEPEASKEGFDPFGDQLSRDYESFTNEVYSRFNGEY